LSPELLNKLLNRLPQIVLTVPPVLGSIDNPYFSRSNVSEFFERFKALCLNYSVPLNNNDDMLVRKVVANVNKGLRSRCKHLDGVDLADYESFKRAIIR
jgi:hypothetical protein